MTITATDRDTGAVVELDDAEAATQWAEGRVDLPAGAAVPMLSPDGKVGTMSVERMGEALQNGYQLSTREAVDAASRASTYGGTADQIAAAAAGTARSLTMGGTDALAVAALGDDARRYLRGIREENPIATTGGEVVGAIAPALATRGASAPRGLSGVATALPRLATRFGAVTEQAALRALPQASSALGRVAVRGLAGAAGAAAESLPYAVGHQLVTESVLGDRDRTAQEILAAIGYETLAGGAAGGILSGGGAALREAGGAAVDRLRAGAGSALAKRISAAGDSAVGPGASRLESAALDALELTTGKRHASLPDALEAFAAARAAKATGGLKKHQDALRQMAERNPAAHKRVGELMLEELPTTVGANGLENMSRDDMARGAATIKDRVSSEFDDITRQIQDAAEQAIGKRRSAAAFRPDVERMSLRIHELGDALLADPTSKGVGQEIKQYAIDLAKAYSGQRRTIDNLRKARGLIDKERINWATGTKLRNETWKEVRRVIESEVESTFDRASAQLGGDLGERYARAKVDYAAVRWIEDAVNDGLSREASNRTLGLSEQISGAGGALLGGLLGGGIGAGLAGAAAAVGSRIIKDRGDAIAAGVAHGLAKGQSITTIANLSLVQDGLRKRITSGIGGYVRGALAATERAPRTAATAVARAAVSTREKPLEKRRPPADVTARFERAREIILRHKTDPAGAAERIARSVAPIVEDAPGTTAALIARIKAASDFAASKLPREPQPSSPLAPKATERGVPDYQQREFLKVVDAMNDPVGEIVSQLKAGKLDRATVDTVKIVAPAVFADMQLAAMQRIAASETAVGYNDRIQLGMLLDIPADLSLEPARVAAIQESYAVTGTGEDREMPGRGGPSATAESAKKTATDSERLAGG